MRVETVIGSGTRGTQPTPSADAIGQLYVVTDEDIIERWDGSDWVQVAINAAGSSPLPWQHRIIPASDSANASNGTWTIASHSDAGGPFAGGDGKGLACENSAGYIEWAIVLEAGTWNFRVNVRRSTNTAILTLALDGTSIGTIDTYNGSPDEYWGAVNGVTVATTGKKLFRISTPTKNGSSSSYACTIRCIDIRRTT